MPGSTGVGGTDGCGVVMVCACVSGALSAAATVCVAAPGSMGLMATFSDKDAKTLWEEARELLGSNAVQPVALGDCSDMEAGGLLRQATLARDVVIEGAPAQYTKDPTRSTPPPPVRSTRPLEVASRYAPLGLGHLKRALDAMLSEWPAASPSQGWQRATYEKLVAQMGRNSSLADVLYLPLGLGKTFIARRWLQ
jgi:hypothetical protein